MCPKIPKYLSPENSNLDQVFLSAVAVANIPGRLDSNCHSRLPRILMGEEREQLEGSRHDEDPVVLAKRMDRELQL